MTNLPRLSTIKKYSGHFPFRLHFFFRRHISNYSTQKTLGLFLKTNYNIFIYNVSYLILQEEKGNS